MKIIVLDDSQTVLLTIQSLLEDLEVSEEEIVLFKNGNEALDYIGQNGADIIFSDIQMPGISGYKFVEKLLELSQQFVPTLFIVSADENYTNILKMKQIGAKRFIRKPINSQYFKHFVGPEIAKIRSKTLKDCHKTDVENELELITIETKEPVFELDFDYEMLAERIGINAKYIPRLVKSFISEVKSVIEGLKDPIENKEFSKIAAYAHSLKGSAGNMKFDTLYEMAKTLEHAALTEDDMFTYAECYEKIKHGLEASFRIA